MTVGVDEVGEISDSVDDDVDFSGRFCVVADEDGVMIVETQLGAAGGLAEDPAKLILTSESPRVRDRIGGWVDAMVILWRRVEGVR